MFYEYAVEPAVLTNWQTVRYFLDAFGPWRGRFLAEFPRNWKRMVYEGLACPDVEKHRIIEGLRTLDASAMSPRSGWLYDAEKTWRENAEDEHRRQGFRAVIVASDPAGAFVAADDAEDRHPLWRTEPGCDVAREPEAFCRVLGLLLRASRHVAIIDPYFRADQGDKLLPLVHLCRVLAGRGVAIDVHASDAALDYREFVRVAQRAIPKVLPAGTAVTLHCWHARDPGEPGERFHNRFVLTDVGGVQFGDSIEQGDPGQHDRLSLLGRDERARWWSVFYGPTLAFDPAGPPIRVAAGP